MSPLPMLSIEFALDLLSSIADGPWSARPKPVGRLDSVMFSVTLAFNVRESLFGCGPFIGVSRSVLFVL